MRLRQALFFDLGCSVLKLPTSIIDALCVDEIGQVWFFVGRPTQHVSEFRKDFFSRLEFYRKGEDFYLHVSGRASIVSDPEDINSIISLPQEYKQLANNKAILVRLKVDEIFYHPLPQAAPVTGSEAARTHFQPSAIVKALQYIVKDVIPVFQSH